MTTRSVVSTTVVLGLLAMAAVLGIVMGQRTALGQYYDVVATPETDTNLVGDDHTVTATVTLDAIEQEGVDVSFEVTDGPNAGDSATDTTDVNGEATFTYTGDGGTGTDMIEVCALPVLPNGASAAAIQQQPDCVEVEKVWEEPTPTPSPTPAPTPTPTPTATPTPTPAEEEAADVLPPTGTEPAEDGGFPWAVVGLAVGGLVLVASGAIVLRRAR